MALRVRQRDRRLPRVPAEVPQRGPLFLDAHRTELQGKPLFIFAVGGGPRLAPELTAELRRFPTREVTYFRGAITEETLSFFEKLQLKVAKQPSDADYRDW
ncbi:flavodoxin domain-containing protein [Nesterenkonia pannonica]|uniref:flavodoxin domain-containing protein n=1 Tax=Nesterenkonia pannonica TaxID=1548602 RepID=UPI00216469A2|nr:flavodoxin domain-containing protein [Nesterenkonia pannonica]